MISLIPELIIDLIGILVNSKYEGFVFCFLFFLLGIAVFLTARDFDENDRGFYVAGVILIAGGFLFLFSSIASCCRTETKESLECTSCHKELDEEDVYCPNCGIKIELETE